MCYSPINVINPSKYVSLKYRDRYVMQVPCGKCAACLSVKSNEWNYRLYHQALDTFERGGFVLFDTLTYSNEYLPHISDYFSVSSAVDFPCFRANDLRTFIAVLRQRCKRLYASNFSYFIASEYGTSENHLHRPHYHALFFVRGGISPLDFSRLVSELWYFGRTDGIPYRSPLYVLRNVFNTLNAGAIRSLRYVCKYIQKDSTFQKNINARLDLIMNDVVSRFVSQGIENWAESSHYWRFRESLMRRINQFHRQSTFLGASVLRDIDLDSLFKTGCLNIPDPTFVVRSIPLPTYFKRKLFYELVSVDGALSWQPTSLGYEYLQARDKCQVESLANRFDAVAIHLGIKYDSNRLADYVLHRRGRFLAGSAPSTLEQRLANLSFYNYSNRYDKEWFSSTGLSRRWLGNSSTGYHRFRSSFQRINDFIKRNVYFDADFEAILDKISAFRLVLDDGRQELFTRKQHLTNLFHHFFVPM